MDNKMAFHEKQKGLCFFNIFHMVEVKKNCEKTANFCPNSPYFTSEPTPA